MFDLREIDDRTGATPDSRWRRFEALRAADLRPAAPARRPPPPPAPPPRPAPRAGRAFGAGFAGGAAGLALALAALAALGPGTAARDARAPVAMTAAGPAAATDPGPASSRLTAGPSAEGAPPRRVAPPAAPAFGQRASAPIAPREAAADAPAPPPPAARAVAAAPWVVVHVAGATSGAERLVAALRAAGFANVRVRQVPAGVARTDLRYFHAADRAAAIAAARVLRQERPPAAVRDFTHYRPSPQAGLIEIWMDRKVERPRRPEG